MNSLKKISTISILALFLVSFVGVEFYKHYCGCSGGVDISIYYEKSCCSEPEIVEEESCCGEEAETMSSHCEVTDEASCDTHSECETEVELYSIDSDFLKPEIKSLQEFDSELVLFSRLEYEIDRDITTPDHTTTYDNDIGDITSLIILYQNRCSIKSDNDSDLS